MIQPSESRPTLARACEPLFLYLTGFRRNAGTSKASQAEVSRDLVRVLDKVRAVCESDIQLQGLFERIRYALVAAADQVVLTSHWTHRVSWGMNLLETQLFGRAEGGSAFFRVVDEVLGDPGDTASELAEVLFTCMALGFQGEYLNEPKQLDRKRRQLFEKARLVGAIGSPICPEAYGRNVAKDLTRVPTVSTLRLLGIAGASLLFAWFAGRAATTIVNAEDLQMIKSYLTRLNANQDSLPLEPGSPEQQR